jgi:hypothetical protein
LHTPSVQTPRWLPENPEEEVDLSELTYDQRQSLIIVSPQVAEASREMLRLLGTDATGELLNRIGQRLGNTKGAFSILALTAASPSVMPLAVGGGGIAVFTGGAINYFGKIYKAWRSAQLNLIPITGKEAEALDFPNGNPVENTVYIGSPAIPARYYPAATVFEQVFFEKLEELVILLSRLGAREVESRCVKGYSNDGEIAASGPISNLLLKLEAVLGRSEQKRDDRTQVSKQTAGAPIPREDIATELYWLPREPVWNELIERRYRGRAKAEEIRVAQSSEHTLNAKAAATIKGLPTDISAGGKMTKGRDTIWEVDAVF